MWGERTLNIPARITAQVNIVCTMNTQAVPNLGISHKQNVSPHDIYSLPQKGVKFEIVYHIERGAVLGLTRHQTRKNICHLLVTQEASIGQEVGPCLVFCSNPSHRCLLSYRNLFT